jgi:tetratricopeptide (TPR) repeat protein
LLVLSVISCAVPVPAVALQAPAAAQIQPGASPDAELKTGTELTRKGMLQEAIPHLLAGQRSGSNSFAAGFNLAICYLGTGSYKQAIATLEYLRSNGGNSAATNNLLAQAYIGDGQIARALEVFYEVSSQTPKDEKLYAFIADACTDHQDYALGLQVVEKGLQQLPDSARLHYERALFLGRLDRLDVAKPEFERAAALAPGSYIASLALVQEDLYQDKYSEAVLLLRDAIKAGHGDYQTYSLLGTVLMKQGAAPGDAEFAEAKAALEESARARQDYSATQIALGKLYIMESRFAEAVEHLEIGRRLEPNSSEVYASLAQAYLRLGDRAKARECQEQLSRVLDNKNLAPHP